MEEVIRRFALAALIFTTALAVGCGGDDSPVAGADPCADPNTKCLNVTIRESDWTNDTLYSILPVYGEQTIFSGTATLPGEGIQSVSPGDQVRIALTFSPELIVTREVSNGVQMVASGSTGNNTDVNVQSAVDIKLVGSWDLVSKQLLLKGEQATRLIENTRIAMDTAPSVGDRLRGVTMTFTVPASWSDGTPIAADQPLPFNTFVWAVPYAGDHRGETPPVVVQ